MPEIWTIVYRDGDFVAAHPIESREGALEAARVMRDAGRRILAIRRGRKVLGADAVERLIGG